MNKKYLIAFFLIMALAAAGCKDQSLTESTPKSIVVEAFLYTGENVENVRVSKTLPLGSADAIAPPVSDAQVILYRNGMAYNLSPNPSSPGYYRYSGKDLTVEPGAQFRIEVNYQGSKITASTVVPQMPNNVSLSDTVLKLTPLTVSGPGMGGFMQDTASVYVKWDNPDSSLYYVVLENLETNPAAINTNTGGSGGGPGGFMRRMTFPPSPSKEFLIGRRNLTYYGRHRAIVYKVNQEYADLYESRNQDSRNLNEPLTNIVNGLGVFSAFASKTVYFKVVSQ